MLIITRTSIKLRLTDEVKKMHLFTVGLDFVQKAEDEQVGGIGRKRRMVNGRNHLHQGNGTGQWKPALQSIAELGV